MKLTMNSPKRAKPQSAAQTSTHGGKPAASVAGHACKIQIDPEFSSLIPPLSTDELSQLEDSLLAEKRCRDPLVIWKGHNILLDGHNRLRLCDKHNISFQIIELDFPDREAARSFIIHNQLGRRNLTPEAASYLRGQRYLSQKKPHGGERAETEASAQNEHLKTAERLAREFKVAAITIRRDAKLAEAVDLIGSHCGEEAKKFILSRDARLTRAVILRLAKLSPQEQKKFLEALMRTGKPPRRRSRREDPPTILLPREPKALAEKLLKQLGAKGATAVAKALAEILQSDKTGR